MKILVTGANGFIGSALCPYLTSLGYEVIPAVRRQSGINNEIVINDTTPWKAALNGCDSVIHLAARAHIMQDHEQDPLREFRRINVKTTIELANRAVEAGVRRFVFMSSIKVNGEETSLEGAFRPDDPVDPKDPYAISKWEAEQGLFEIAKRSGLEVIIIRPPLVYGPGVKGNFASLIKLVKSGLPLPFGAVQNHRSMIALDNLLSFTTLCADIDNSPNARSQIFTVSDGEAVSTAELLRRVAYVYKCRSNLFSVPVGFINLMSRWMGKSSVANRLLKSLVIDDSKARQMLAWHPPLSMYEQLKKMAQYDSCI